MTIEKLTDEERRSLAGLGYGIGTATGPKALAMIDNLTEALAAAEDGERRHLEASEEWEHLCRKAEAELAALRELVGKALRALTNLNASDATRVVDALEALRGR